MAPTVDRLSIGEMSRRTVCNVETIRYYERTGLIPRPPRTAGGHRIYGEEDRRRLAFIRRCRELGFSLDAVRELLRLVDRGTVTCGEVQAVTLARLEEVRAKIADLGRLEVALSGMAASCEGGAVPECPVIDALSEESAPVSRGPGAAP